MGRNYLAHSTGDVINAVLAAAGYNFRRLLRWLRLLLVRILVHWDARCFSRGMAWGLLGATMSLGTGESTTARLSPPLRTESSPSQRPLTAKEFSGEASSDATAPTSLNMGGSARSCAGLKSRHQVAAA
jgi:hypothetical protein